ncbi:MAG: response regulator transcription factor [Bradymonadia bacterium]
MATILITDDDGHIREVVRFALEQAGHSVVEAADGLAALRAFDDTPIDAIVLDILMPELDGLEVCRRIRAHSDAAKREVPILFLSSKDEEFDRILGLEMGADDYVTKPFSPRELAVRVKVMLRRSQARSVIDPQGAILRHSAITLDLQRHRCLLGQDEIVLTVTEFDLLRTLMGHPGKVYTRGELVDRVWGPGHHITDRTIDSHIRRIRGKFNALVPESDPVETVYGLGYRLKTAGGSP